MKKLATFPIVLLLVSVVAMQTAKAEEPARQQPVKHVTKTKTYQRIKNAVDQIWIIDTHEHLQDEYRYLKRPADFLAMLNYVASDLISSGMTFEQLRYIQDQKVPLPKRWEVFQKYWKEIRFTGYSRAIRRSIQDLYGIDVDTLTPETAHLLNEKIVAAHKPGIYRHVLKDKARIDLSIVDRNSVTPTPGLFVQVRRFDNFVNIFNSKKLNSLAKLTGMKIDSLEDLCRALETQFEKDTNKPGVVAVKSALAYDRRIFYPLPTEAQAKAAFDKVKSGKPVPYAEILPLQNYMMHQICKLAEKHDLPFQFHTGLQTGSGNTITNSKPTDLVSLISKYPKVKFVIFHGSYPYGHELSTIAKNFPNAYIDMCWLHIISPKISRDSLSEWLETVPANKITCFGGDYNTIESVYGHAEMAREAVAEVLAEKVLRGYLTEAEACELAVKLLRNNAIDIYQLKLPEKTTPADEKKNDAKKDDASPAKK